MLDLGPADKSHACNFINRTRNVLQILVQHVQEIALKNTVGNPYIVAVPAA